MAITPENILPDALNHTHINGIKVRKGTVAALLANIQLYESPQSAEREKQSALAMIKELAPAILAIGLTQHLQFKNPEIQKIMDHAG